MQSVWDSQRMYPLNPHSSQATRSHPGKAMSKELWTKGPEWNNAAYEERKKSHYFTHPAQDTPISIKQ